VPGHPASRREGIPLPGRLLRQPGCPADVGRRIVEHRDRFPAPVATAADRLAEISHRLRQEREFAFCGDDDFVPTDEYTADDARGALDDARFVVGLLDPFPAQDV